MTKKVFVWVAHPKAGSLCAGLADAYIKGATSKGAEVRRMDLSEMEFAKDASFDGYNADKTPLAPDLVAWQDGIKWADHVMIIHPYWWGAMPTQAKAVLDIALEPGFAFKYHARGVKWDKLLAGRTGDAIITSDTPPWMDSLLYRKPGRRVIKNQIMDFVGIKPRKVIQLGSVKLADASKIGRWMRKVQQMGAGAAA